LIPPPFLPSPHILFFSFLRSSLKYPSCRLQFFGRTDIGGPIVPSCLTVYQPILLPLSRDGLVLKRVRVAFHSGGVPSPFVRSPCNFLLTLVAAALTQRKRRSPKCFKTPKIPATSRSILLPLLPAPFGCSSLYSGSRLKRRSFLSPPFRHALTFPSPHLSLSVRP